MPADSLTAPLWAALLERWTPTNSDAATLASVLKDIVAESNDPVIGKILDRHTKEMMP
jgi:hypothetical protein